MTSLGFGDDSLTAKRRRAAFRSAAFFLVGSGATLAAIGAALEPGLPASEWALALLEICALLGFFRFGWWISHLRAIEERMAGAGARPVAEESVFW